MKYYILSFMLFFMASCQSSGDSNTNAIDKSLSTWAEAYFNFDYEKAMKYMTPESGKWIRYAASNITENDISFIKTQNKQTRIEIIDHQLQGDTLCYATIRVSDFVQLGVEAQDNKAIDQADFYIKLVKRDGDWLVRTEGLPRSEKQSRD